MNRLNFLLFLLLFTACDNNSVRTNKDDNKVFFYEPLGWEMLLPDNWEVLSKSQLDKLDYAAQNYYEQNETGNTGEKKLILGIRRTKDDINACYAFVRQYRKGDDPPNLADLLNQQLRQYSTGAYSTEKSLSQRTIDGKIFDVGTLKVNYNDKPYFIYTTYSTMLGDTNFGVSIITNNLADEEMLVANFRNSVSTLKE